MPANRFFYEGALIEEEQITLIGPEHHHLRVMRVEPDDEIEIVNGTGVLALATLLSCHKDSAKLVVTNVTKSPSPKQHITLVIPLMRPNKLEWIAEKATELGASELCFYTADFSEKNELSSNQLERLHILFIAALKQSGRLYLPSLALFPSLEKAVHQEALYLFGDTSRSGTNLLEVPCTERMALVTGPEKGFSDDEVALLEKRGAKGVCLNPNILRAETAPIAGLSVLALRGQPVA